MTLEQILENVVVCPSGCHLWLGGDSGTGRGGGYPRVRHGGRVRAAHQVVWEATHGPVPDGHEIDHMCARWSPHPRLNRRCIRLDHLQVLPYVVNTRLSTRWRNEP